MRKGKGWHNESRRHSLASKGIKTAQKIPKMPKPKEQDPYKFQDTHQERIIHAPGWEKGNSYRYVLEGTGDIFRELSKPDPDEAYIDEKLKRLERHFEDIKEGRRYFPETGIHPEDSWQYSYENNKDKFKRMIELWKMQPYKTKLQKKAINLNIAMLKGQHGKAKKIVKEIKSAL